MIDRTLESSDGYDIGEKCWVGYLRELMGRILERSNG